MYIKINIIFVREGNQNCFRAEIYFSTLIKTLSKDIVFFFVPLIFISFYYLNEVKNKNKYLFLRNL